MALGRPKTPRSDPDANTDTHGATTGYEAELWQMADAFEDRHALLESEREGFWCRSNRSRSESKERKRP